MIQFSYHERMLAVVPRWSIAPRLNPQTVAEHSFYVALYTDKLARVLEWDERKALAAVRFALRHDMVESKTGDTPGPIKREIVDKEKLSAFQCSYFKLLGGDYGNFDEPGYRLEDIIQVVKLADLIDEMFWISMEVNMGNRLMEHQRAKVLSRLGQAAQVLGMYELPLQISQECANMARGIDLPENNSDLQR